MIDRHFTIGNIINDDGIFRVINNDLPGISEFVVSEGEIGRFVRPSQLIVKHGAKWSWTNLLEETVMDELITGPFSFLDAFGGTGIVTYAVCSGDHKEFLKNAYWNDSDINTYNLFRVLKTDSGSLERITMALGSNFAKTIRQGNKDMIHRFFDMLKLNTEEGDMNFRAACYILTMKMSYGGMGENCGVSALSREKPARKAENAWKNIRPWYNVFSKVNIWRKDFRQAIRDFIEKEEDVQRICFLDPPYIGVEGGMRYRETMTPEDHRDLAKIIQERKCDYILTHIINDEFRQIYGYGDDEIEVDVKYTVDRGHNSKREVISIFHSKQ